ncbi:MAG: M20/M25/M40 family metallo-hydrolase [Crocinitomicaceae bacterium]|nr:M20/M25/M40 family metallo-hydrolase [Crocinitomicaceae bacterium]
MFRWFGILFVGLSSFGLSQVEYAREIMSELCSDNYKGRGYVDSGDIKASQFIADELESIGVEAGSKTGYFQEYSFSVNTFPYAIEVKLDDSLLTPGENYLISPYSGTAQGKFDVVPINSENYFTTYGGNVVPQKGKKEQVVYAFNFTDYAPGETLSDIQKNAYQIAQYYPVIWVTNQKQMYSVGRFHLNYPIIEIDSSAYNSPEEVYIKVNNKYIPKYTTRNVIGKIKGKKKRKYIVFSAHFDHLGMMGPDAMFPGANDNASGVAMLLSLAKHYVDNKPDYTIYFCFFSGEEAGLEGSKYFVSHPTFKLKRVNFVLNIDIMGGAEDGITLVNGTKHTEAFEKIQEINLAMNLLNRVKKRGPTANSDHYYFSESGIPSFFIYSMGNVSNYHDIFDTAENTTLGKFDEVETLLKSFLLEYGFQL